MMATRRRRSPFRRTRLLLALAAASAVVAAPIRLGPGGLSLDAGWIPIRGGLVPMPPFGPRAVGPGDPRVGTEHWWRSPRPGLLAWIGIAWPARSRAPEEGAAS